MGWALLSRYVVPIADTSEQGTESEVKNLDITKLKIPLATAGGLIAAWFGRSWELIFLVFAVILLDYITGLLAGRANEGINSKRAAQGLYKKTGFILLLVFGFFLDIAFNNFIALGFSVQIPFNLPIGLIISVWIVVTEAVSICENLDRMGVPIPAWLLKLLKKTQDEIDSGDGGKS